MSLSDFVELVLFSMTVWMLQATDILRFHVRECNRLDWISSNWRRLGLREVEQYSNRVVHELRLVPRWSAAECEV